MLHRSPRLGRVWLLWLWPVVILAQSQQGGDLQARILYAYHAEDANQLASLIQTLETESQAGGADNALRYHLAHAQYRAGLLSQPTDEHAAGAAFAACTSELKPLLQQDARSVEVLVLQSACFSNLARFERMGAALDRARAADYLSTAAKLAPRNPRVLYFEAMDGFARASPGSAEAERAFGQLQLAVQLFEASSATDVDRPGWGHAEAYLEMGRRLQSRGDIVGARNWIEKSLIMAPDFKAAQRQLASLVRR
jgi:tetratricopeptide (TPR) repeat protein